MNPAGNSYRHPGGRLSAAQILLGLFGLVAPVLTFMLAISDLPDSLKIFLLVVLAAGYAVICLWSFQRSHAEDRRAAEASPRDHLEDSLNAIGEASEFFGSSLKPADLFRLVSSRVAHVFPFEASALFVEGETTETLQVAQIDGEIAERLLRAEVPLDRGLASMAWVSGEVEVDADLKLESAALPAGAVTGYSSAVAIPLLHEGRAFAVMVLYTKDPIKRTTVLNETFESIGDRVAPLFLSSMSSERSIASALTDSLTSLPNERAFYMVLENQLAESQRFRDERPLTILAVDIKGFADANQSFGFAVGDRMLSFTAEKLISQLRKMDFLSRSSNDEFLIMLPTASEKYTGEIIQRIRDRFAAEPFEISETEQTKVWLNFGWATFWQDGETAEQLLQNARIRKQQSKAEEPSKVLWFPKEYVN